MGQTDVYFISYKLFNFFYWYLYLFVLTFSSRKSASSKFKLIFLGALQCFLKFVCRKLRKFIRSILIQSNLTSNLNLNLKFCVVPRNAIQRSCAKKKVKKKLSVQYWYIPFMIYSNFSYLRVLKPVGRTDPSRLEKVRVYCFYRIQYKYKYL